MQGINRDNLRNKIVGISLIVAPFGLLLGWTVLMLRSEQGPNVGWFLSHLLLLAGAILFIPAVIGLRTLLGRDALRVGNIGAGLALVGAATLVGQFVIDLVVGYVSTTPTEMSALLRQISSTPGIALPFYTLGPIAFYSALIILVITLLTHRRISLWIGALIVIGIVAVAGQALIGNAILTLLGFTLMAVGFVPIGRNVLGNSKPVY